MSALEDLVEPRRVLADLDRLHALTADDHGAQRVAWTDTWEAARAWLRDCVADLAVTTDLDPAGNLWIVPVDAPRPLVTIGSHLDSVPNGGRYDGALGVLAGLELLRAAEGLPGLAHGIALVDFADEEGARFGHSLFGSTALLGRLDVAALAALVDGDGTTLADALAAHAVTLGSANAAAATRPDVHAYLELHIEQGPELEARGIAVAAVTGASGIDRLRARIRGETTHAGATTMEDRHDPLLSAAGAIVEIAEAAARLGGLATFGRCDVAPSIATAVPASVEITVDLRHADAGRLAQLSELARAALASASERRGCELELSPLWRMAPVDFDAVLVQAAAEAAAWAGGSDAQVVSARGHDAVVLAQELPVAMLFCPSARGLSHDRNEHTDAADVVRAVRALARLAGRVAAGDVVPLSRPQTPIQEVS